MRIVFNLIMKLKDILFNYYIKDKLTFIDLEAKKTFFAESGTKIYNPNVIVGRNVKLYHNVIIFGEGKVEIGDNTKIGYNTVIYADKNGGIKIGNNCLIAANSYIIDTNHSTDLTNEDKSERVIIGNDVWISALCTIAKGSILGNHSIVGANSFVNSVVPENAIVAGAPAKIKKYREGN